MKILFCNESFPEAISRLKALLLDHELILCRDADIADHIEEVDVVVPLTATIDSALIERGRFGLIQHFGVGLDPVDIEAATWAGVRVARIPSAYSGNADSVAEHALLLMLSLARQMPAAQKAFSERQLGQPIGRALVDKRACVVGLGGVGLAVARRLNAFGMRLVGVHEHSERGVPAEVGLSQVFTLPELHEAIAEAD